MYSGMATKGTSRAEAMKNQVHSQLPFLTEITLDGTCSFLNSC